MIEQLQLHFSIGTSLNGGVGVGEIGKKSISVTEVVRIDREKDKRYSGENECGVSEDIFVKSARRHLVVEIAEPIRSR